MALDNSLFLDNGLLLGTVSQVSNVAHGPIVFATLFVLFFRGGSIVVVGSFAGYKPSEVRSLRVLFSPKLID